MSIMVLFLSSLLLQVFQGPGDTIYMPSQTPHAVLNLDHSIGVTENIMTLEALMELPHKLVLGGSILPDLEERRGERREERLWKCLMRGRLGLEEREVMREGLRQVEGKLGERRGGMVCLQASYGRTWLRVREGSEGDEEQIEGGHVFKE